MSLVPTYVGAQDGRFYRNPVIFGQRETRWWFICWDDDDPTELVIQAGSDSRLPERILEEQRIAYKSVRPNRTCSRTFPQNNYRKFRPAVSYWLELCEPIPVPKLHTGVYAGRGEAVFYPYGLEIPHGA